jgi:prepilin-type N-terminal cleavage/methylation domain-containing protein
MRTPIGADRRGFTLIEVLMAAFVLAIGVLGLTALFAGAARQQQLSTQTTRSVAAARSADAFIAERFGPIESVDGAAELKLGGAQDLPRNNQGPDTNVVQNDQWYAIPRAADGSLSLNPREATSGWKNDTLYTRARPREVLPKLMYRMRQEQRINEFVPTGDPGGDKAIPNQVSVLLRDSLFAAPAFDGSLRELRAIADSITVRVITRSFPCQGSVRPVNTPDDEEIVLRWDGSEVNAPVYTLSDGSDNEMRITIDSTSKDSELLQNGSVSEFNYAYIQDIVASTVSSTDCVSGRKIWIEASDPACEPPTDYLWETTDPLLATFDDAPFLYSVPGYDLANEPIDGVDRLVARLRPTDECQPNALVFEQFPAPGAGKYMLGPTDGSMPPGATGAAPIRVREANIPDRFIHEIWLDSYEYRGHTLASLPETISYAPSEGATGTRVPQIGYSMLYRRTSNSAVQYALLSYAIAPTNPAGADKADTSNDDFFPREDAGAFTSNAAPIRLVQDLRLVFDEDLGQYYVELTGARATALGFVATPGQVLMFNGDASRTPPVPGADGPVRVVSVRRVGGSEVRAYLDGPPRAGLRALTDFDAGDEFDAWVVQARCELMQKVKPSSTPIYYWGLRPLEVRIFTISR